MRRREFRAAIIATAVNLWQWKFVAAWGKFCEIFMHFGGDEAWWVGTAGDWNDRLNWSTYRVPDIETSVVIETGEVRIHQGSFAKVYSIEFQERAEMRIDGEVEVAGDLIFKA